MLFIQLVNCVLSLDGNNNEIPASLTLQVVTYKIDLKRNNNL